MQATAVGTKAAEFLPVIGPAFAIYLKANLALQVYVPRQI